MNCPPPPNNLGSRTAYGNNNYRMSAFIVLCSILFLIKEASAIYICEDPKTTMKEKIRGTVIQAVENYAMSVWPSLGENACTAYFRVAT